MNKLSLLTLLLASVAFGCKRKLRTTVSFANHLFIEYFIVNPAGVDEAFLTDSSNFRVYIGKYDSDHERVRCKLEGDTITIFKYNTGGPGGKWVVTDQAQLFRESLEKNKVQSDKPLFNFR
jgi:hypothetical protein